MKLCGSRLTVAAVRYRVVYQTGNDLIHERAATPWAQQQQLAWLG
jgi:hypothetical protein